MKSAEAIALAMAVGMGAAPNGLPPIRMVAKDPDPRKDPSVRTAKDLERLAAAEAKRERRRQKLDAAALDGGES